MSFRRIPGIEGGRDTRMGTNKMGADAGALAVLNHAAADERNIPSRAMWCSLILVGLLFSLPLVQPRHTNPITSFYSEWLAMVLGAAALFPLVMRRYSTPLRVPWITLMPAALAGVLAVHLVMVKSAYPQPPLLAIIYLIWTAGLMLVAAALRREFGLERLVAILAGFLLAGGVFNALAGILQHYEWRGGFESVVATKLAYQVYGNLGQPNHFATHITLALVSLGFLYATGRASSRWTTAGSAVMLFVLSLSGSRSAWVYLISITILAGLTYRATRSTDMRRAMLFAVALVPGLAVAHLIAQLPWLAPPTLHTTVIDRLFTLAATPSERLQLWREAWAMFLGEPVLGVGWGQFAWHNFMLAGELDGMALTGLYNHAHNLVLHLLAETGIVGAAVAGAGIVLWVRNAWPLLPSSSGLWIWACAAVLGLHSMLEYPLWNAHFLGIACIVLSVGDPRSLQLYQARLIRVGVVIFMAGTAWVSAVLLDRYHRLENIVHTSYSGKNRAALEQAHREMLAVRESFFLTPYVELAYARDIELSVADIDRKLAFVARVMRFAPTGMVAYRYAALHALAGNDEQAYELLRRAVVAYPNVLESFAREFSETATGDAQARARFAAMLRTLADERRPAKSRANGDENRHFPPNLGVIK